VTTSLTMSDNTAKETAVVYQRPVVALVDTPKMLSMPVGAGFIEQGMGQATLQARETSPKGTQNNGRPQICQ